MPVVGLHATLARRLQALVLLVAPLPLGFLVWMAIGQYQDQLARETEHRLDARAKDAGLEVYRRLQGLENDLRLVVAGEAGEERTLGGTTVPAILRDRFRSLAVGAPAAAMRPADLPEFSAEQLKRLGSHQSVLLTPETGAPGASLWLAVPLSGPSLTVVCGEIEPAWLWPSAGVPADPGHDLVLLDSGRARALLASSAVPAELLAALSAESLESRQSFEWKGPAGRLHRAGIWTVPLGFEFGHPGLRALVSELDVLSPAVARLSRSLVLVAVGALLLAWLIGLIRLRSDLEPLAALSDGTRRLTEGDFGARVSIAGPTDLMRLGEAFNGMAHRIERQFRLLDAARSVAESALAPVPRDEEVARTFLERVAGLVPGADVIVVLYPERGRGLVLRRLAGSGELERREVGQDELGGLVDVEPSDRWVNLEETAVFLRPERSGKPATWRQLRHGGRLLASVGLVGATPEANLRAGEAVVRDLADQLALALFRVHLMADLARANWGALTALARAVDAKSPWTHGHSSRVAEIAVLLAAEVGWSEDEIAIVRRGCLLHDVGKIGVPGKVLDKSERLTPDELALLQTHVEKGVRIIEPIEGLSETLPIIAQHHERLDGSGYPHALRGADIHPQARMAAVADVFEALTAPRPYRAALPAHAAEEFLVRRAVEQFDERFVEALRAARKRGVIDALLDPSAVPA